MYLPWQKDEWQQLQTAKKHERLPHALLFTGSKGIGKKQFAENFASAMLCTQLQDTMPCGVCHACRLVQSKTHPNVLWLMPENESHAIKIDQVRAANEFIQHSSLQGESRLLIIYPADKMNLNAANALLKTLEEPAKDALIILINDQSVSLPATILSRCQRIVFATPDKTVAINWLQAQIDTQAYSAELLLTLSNGAPFTALQLIEKNVLSLRQQLFNGFYALALKKESPVQLAEFFKDSELLLLIDCLLSWVTDILHLHLQTDCLKNSDFKNQLLELKMIYDKQFIENFLTDVFAIRKQLQGMVNLNKQLLLEDIFVRWMMRIVSNKEIHHVC